MIDIQKQRRIGQIIMTCKIIQSENEDLSKVPRINVSDIQKWLDAGENYVAVLLNVCATLDKRNIADAVLNNARIYSDMNKRNGYRIALIKLWSYYLNYVLEKEDESYISQLIDKMILDNKDIELSQEMLSELLQSFIEEIVLRVHELSVSNMHALDAVLEIADLRISEEEYLKLRKQYLGIDVKEDDNTDNM